MFYLTSRPDDSDATQVGGALSWEIVEGGRGGRETDRVCGGGLVCSSKWDGQAGTQ